MAALKTTIADKDWVKRSYMVAPVDATAALVRFVADIDTAQAETLIAAHDVDTVADPIADGVKWDGTFAVSSVRAEPGQDRHCTIVQELKLLRSIDADLAKTPIVELAALDSIKQCTNVIEQPFAFPEAQLTAVGAAVRTAAEGESDFVKYTWRNLDPSDETIFRTTITDDQLMDNIETTLAYVTRDWVLMADNTATGVVLFAKRAWHSGVAAEDSMLLSAGGKIAKATRVWPRRTKAAAITLTSTTGVALDSFNDLQTAPAATYNHLSFHIQDHGDGAYTVIQQGIVDWVASIGNSAESYITCDSYIEKSVRKPVESTTLTDAPADGYYWRIVQEEADVRITYSKGSAIDHVWNTTTHVLAAGALIGSNSIYIGGGLFKATKITNRDVTVWYATSLSDVALFKGA